MSFSFPGTTPDSVLISEAPNLPSSTGAATVTLWLKRTGDFTGRKYVVTIRSATTGNNFFVNSPSNTVPYGVQVDANYGAADALINEALASGVWMFGAMVGSGSNWSLKIWDTDTSAYLTATIGQTAFAPNTIMFGGDWGSPNFVGLMAHIRVWNVALSDAELTAEKNSETRVKTSGSVAVHSGAGGTIAAALTGQVGAAMINGGTVGYSADMPSFVTFTGTVISGTAQMPTVDVVDTTGSRYNRILWSDDLTNVVWSKDSHTVVQYATHPAGPVAGLAGHGLSHRLILTSTSGGFYQAMSGLPLGIGTMSCRVRRVNCDRFTLRHMGDGIVNGVTVVFNILNGTVNSTIFHGAVNNNGVIPGIRNLGGGWYLIWITVTQGITGSNRIMGFYPTSSDNPARLIAGLHTDFSGPQYEHDVLGVATTYKPTQSAIVSRNLASVTLQLSSLTSAIGQQTTATVQALDGASAPWDLFGPVAYVVSDPTKAQLTPSTAFTDVDGRNVAPIVGLAAGTTNISASVGTSPNQFFSPSLSLTVSGVLIPRQIDVRVEFGWGGTSGWYAGVYEKHPSQRFPTNKYFEVSGQSFVTLGDQSQMKIDVPAGVPLVAGTQVEVVIENDNINGAAVDGPGIFSATVI